MPPGQCCGSLRSRVPAASRAAVAEAVLSRLSGRTRLLTVDHVASCSGLVFPVEEIVAECRREGVPVLVDGAHAAGMLPVDLGELGADFWVGKHAQVGVRTQGIGGAACRA